MCDFDSNRMGASFSSPAPSVQAEAMVAAPPQGCPMHQEAQPAKGNVDISSCLPLHDPQDDSHLNQMLCLQQCRHRPGVPCISPSLHKVKLPVRYSRTWSLFCFHNTNTALTDVFCSVATFTVPHAPGRSGSCPSGPGLRVCWMSNESSSSSRQQ